MFPWPWPEEQLPRKEQVVPFTVSSQLLHSPFLHSTGKRGGGCGNVLALQSQAGRSVCRECREVGCSRQLPACLCRPRDLHCQALGCCCGAGEPHGPALLPCHQLDVVHGWCSHGRAAVLAEPLLCPQQSPAAVVSCFGSARAGTNQSRFPAPLTPQSSGSPSRWTLPSRASNEPAV